jgi:hypothetical protein
VCATPVKRTKRWIHAGLATPSPDRLPRHPLDSGRGAARGIGESKEGWLVRQVERPGVRCRDIRVPTSRSAPQGAGQALAPSGRRVPEGLGGEQSPWKDRAFVDLQRSVDVTDSSAEQGPEVGRSSEDHRVGDGPGSSKPIVEAIREGRRARVQRRSAPTSVGSMDRRATGGRQPTPHPATIWTPQSRHDADPERAGTESSGPPGEGRSALAGLPPRWLESRGEASQRRLRPDRRRRGDVGAYSGRPEHHHLGQGSALFPKVSNQTPARSIGGTGRREPTRSCGLASPGPRLGWDPGRPPPGGWPRNRVGAVRKPANRCHRVHSRLCMSRYRPRGGKDASSRGDRPTSPLAGGAAPAVPATS